jgi:hypothetical protein
MTGIVDDVDTHGSMSAGSFTRGWQHGIVAKPMEDEAAPDSVGGARSTVRRTMRRLFGDFWHAVA